MTKEEAMRNYIEHIQLILETIPISEEVSELVQKLGSFYTEVDEEEEEMENKTDKRPFTRPFAGQTDDLVKSLKGPTMEGYGDLWDDIQNLQETRTERSLRGLNLRSEEAEASKESSQTETKEESCVWRGLEEDEENWDGSINSVSEDEDEEQDWRLDPSVSTVDVERWRSDTESSGSSLEPSMSSFTKGAHSSFNSEEEELEPRGQKDPHDQSSQHFRGSQSPELVCDSLRCIGVDAARRCVSKNRHLVRVRRTKVNMQIAAALLRLQENMANVLHRLHVLEELNKPQSRSSSPHQEEVFRFALKVLFLRPSWWPFDYAPMTVVLTTFWSLITHWLVQLYLQQKRRIDSSHPTGHSEHSLPAS
ncbi:acyl-CoA-binding domain-containing protein 5-B [Nematolebias whitei]|uniref:acyl-CoA-binding domain-containing protein 5-B n=1 Tax=Nematolebias whitei TaxID=451745 RepID=UPI00189BA172|nr:acyl-CoA-binding domain-containing protein 5-B [Nematolebias whitei]